MNTIKIDNGHRYPVRAGGFTLIELLVAMIILASGVMGVAALQIATYKQLQTSHNFGYAAILAGEMADRMMANTNALADYVHDADTAAAAGTNCSTNTCTSVQMATYDVDRWQTQVAGNTPGSLPSGAGEITSAGSVYTITVRWDDNLSGSDETGCSTSNPDDLDCYTVTIGF